MSHDLLLCSPFFALHALNNLNNFSKFGYVHAAPEMEGNLRQDRFFLFLVRWTMWPTEANSPNVKANCKILNLTWNISHEFHMVFFMRISCRKNTCENHIKTMYKLSHEIHSKIYTGISLLLPFARENFKCMCLWLLLFLDCRMSSFFLCFPEWLSRVKRIGCRSTTWPSCSALPSSGPRQSPQTWPPTWYTRAESWSTAYWNFRQELLVVKPDSLIWVLIWVLICI